MHTHHEHHPDRGARRRRAAFAEWGEGFDGGFGRGRGRGGRGRGGRGRARRGDVRAAVLALLAERPMHGYDIIQELSQRTQGVWQPSPGSVYPTLQMLEEEGLVTGEDAGGKRQFTLTDAGREAVDERTGPAPWDRITRGHDPASIQLWQNFGQAVMAAKQVGNVGNHDQRVRAAAILAETRRQLYAILAEDTPVPADEPEVPPDQG